MSAVSSTVTDTEPGSPNNPIDAKTQSNKVNDEPTPAASSSSTTKKSQAEQANGETAPAFG